MFEPHLTMKELRNRINKKMPLKQCVVCGEQKVCTNYTDYAWKINGKFCCSYSCFRVIEKEELKKNKKISFIKR